MKNLNDFLSEKKTDTSVPHLGKKGEGKDDKKYFALMGEYKKMRRHREDREEAAKILKQAQNLARNGDVSEKCKLGACYL